MPPTQRRSWPAPTTGGGTAPEPPLRRPNPPPTAPAPPPGPTPPSPPPPSRPPRRPPRGAPPPVARRLGPSPSPRPCRPVEPAARRERQPGRQHAASPITLRTPTQDKRPGHPADNDHAELNGIAGSRG